MFWTYCKDPKNPSPDLEDWPGTCQLVIEKNKLWSQTFCGHWFGMISLCHRSRRSLLITCSPGEDCIQAAGSDESWTLSGHDSNDWCSWGVMQLLDFAVFCIGFSAFPLWWRLALRILGRWLKYGSWEAAQWCSACCGPWPCFFWYNFVTGNPKDSSDSHPTFLGTFAPICCTFQGRELMAEKFGIQVMWGIFQVGFAGSCDILWLDCNLIHLNSTSKTSKALVRSCKFNVYPHLMELTTFTMWKASNTAKPKVPKTPAAIRPNARMPNRGS